MCFSVWVSAIVKFIANVSLITVGGSGFLTQDHRIQKHLLLAEHRLTRASVGRSPPPPRRLVQGGWPGHAAASRPLSTPPPPSTTIQSRWTPLGVFALISFEFAVRFGVICDQFLEIFGRHTKSLNPIASGTEVGRSWFGLRTNLPSLKNWRNTKYIYAPKFYIFDFCMWKSPSPPCSPPTPPNFRRFQAGQCARKQRPRTTSTSLPALPHGPSQPKSFCQLTSNTPFLIFYTSIRGKVLWVSIEGVQYGFVCRRSSGWARVVDD